MADEVTPTVTPPEAPPVKPVDEVKSPASPAATHSAVGVISAILGALAASQLKTPDPVVQPVATPPAVECPAPVVCKPVEEVKSEACKDTERLADLSAHIEAALTDIEDSTMSHGLTADQARLYFGLSKALRSK